MELSHLLVGYEALNSYYHHTGVMTNSGFLLLSADEVASQALLNIYT